MTAGASSPRYGDMCGARPKFEEFNDPATWMVDPQTGMRPYPWPANTNPSCSPPFQAVGDDGGLADWKARCNVIFVQSNCLGTLGGQVQMYTLFMPLFYLCMDLVVPACKKAYAAGSRGT